MVLLTLFAFVAGAGTAITPCVLPVLPALLSAGASGGRRRPVGVVLGLALTFTLTIVALASVVKGVGVAGDGARILAVVVLFAAGLVLFVPALGDRLEAPLSRLARFVPARATRGEGFWSGVGLGGALGLLYAPCAGPILAAVISVSATGGTSLRLVVIALAYALGSAAVLLALALGGRAILARVRRAGRGPQVQRALGVVLVLTAVLIVTRTDVRFQEALAQNAPSFLVNPTRGIEDSKAVASRLNGLRPQGRFAQSRPAPPANVAATHLRRYGKAPDFVGNERWFNTPGNRPLTLQELRGRVVLVDFWTYTCINCIRTLPFLRSLDARYRPAGLTIVGVHTPEFPFERDAGNVANAIRTDGLRYPVAQDNAYRTWSAWGNQYWPAEYLIDAAGEVRHVKFGEGDYAESESAARALLAAGHPGRPLPARLTSLPVPPKGAATPETYLGSKRAMGWLPTPPRNGVHDYARPAGAAVPLSRFAYSGKWRITGEDATALAPGAAIDTTVQAQNAYLVLSSKGGRPRRVRVVEPGHKTRVVTVRRQRLYTLAEWPAPGRHHLTVHLAPGISGYAFTFG